MHEAQRITKALDGTWMGKEGRAPCPAHGGYDENLSVQENNGKLLMYCHSHHCEFTDIIAALKGMGIIQSSGAQTYTPPTKAEPKQDDTARKIEWALSIWEQGLPLREGTVAHQYITQTRGRKLLGANDLRAIKSLKLVEKNQPARYQPALIAAVRNVGTHKITGVSRTFLTGDANKITRKFAGITKNAAIMIDKLPPEDGQELAITEGIETALAVRQIVPDTPVWAVASAGNIAALPCPSNRKRISRLIIYADPDGVGLKAAHTCADRWTSKGIPVRIIRERHGRHDFDDLLKQYEGML